MYNFGSDLPYLIWSRKRAIEGESSMDSSVYMTKELQEVLYYTLIVYEDTSSLVCARPQPSFVDAFSIANRVAFSMPTPNNSACHTHMNITLNYRK